MRGIYAITDPTLLADDKLDRYVDAALQGGIKMLQYRNKSADHGLRVKEAMRLQTLCQRYDIPLLINDDIQLCLAVGAAGVHLGQKDSTLREARRLLGGDAIIGITCYNNIEAARRAQTEGASYVAFGRFFPSRTKPDAAPATPQVLSAAKEQLQIPLVAIGGVNAENGASLIAAGADMLAVIDYLFSTPAVASRARELSKLFKPVTD
jgi:thiamine-phosphate pyrophosphorylase